jgi:hypothetical protein
VVVMVNLLNSLLGPYDFQPATSPFEPGGVALHNRIWH